MVFGFKLVWNPASLEFVGNLELLILFLLVFHVDGKIVTILVKIKAVFVSLKGWQMCLKCKF